MTPNLNISRGLLEAPRVKVLLARAARRMAAQRAVLAACHGLTAGLFLAALIVLFHRLVSPEWPLLVPVAVTLALPPLVSVVVSLIASRRDPFSTAVEVERRSALQERMSSIVALRGEAVRADISSALVHDGERCAAELDLRRTLPWRRPPRLWLSGVAALLLAGFFALPDLDLFGARAERESLAEEEKRVEERKERFQKRVEQLRRVAEEQKMSPETRKLLAELQQRRREPLSSDPKRPEKRRALVELQRLREQVDRRLGGREMQKLDRVLDQVRSAGRKLESSEAKQVAKALSEGDLQKASTALRELAKKLESAAKDPDAREALRRDLESLQKKLKDLPSLADADLAKMLDELSSGNIGDLSDMMKGASDDLSDLARLMRERDLLESVQQEIEFTQDELAQLNQEWPEAHSCPNCGKKLEPGAKPGGM